MRYTVTTHNAEASTPIRDTVKGYSMFAIDVVRDLNAAAAALARVEALAAELDAEATEFAKLLDSGDQEEELIAAGRRSAYIDAAARIRAALTGKE